MSEVIGADVFAQRVGKGGGTVNANQHLLDPILHAQNAEGAPLYRVFILSAVGKAYKGDTKSTDDLYGIADSILNHGYDHELEAQVLERYGNAFVDLGSTAVARHQQDFRKSLRYFRDHPARVRRTHGRDVVASLGEEFSTIFAADLHGLPRAATGVRFGWNDFSPLSTRRSILEQDGTLPRNRTVLIPGWLGYNALGNIRTLSRGGSDTAALKYAETLGLDCDIYSDTDGICSADPKLVDGVYNIAALTYEEVFEGAYGGNGNLVGLEYIADSNVTVRLKNAARPLHPGTRVEPTRQPAEGEHAISVSGRKDLVQINIRDTGMVNRSGYAQRRLRMLARLGISFRHLPSSEDSFSFTLDQSTDPDKLSRFAEAATRRLISRNGSVGEPTPRGVVYVVGEGLRDEMNQTDVSAEVMAIARALRIPAELVANAGAPSVAILMAPENVDTMIERIHADVVRGQAEAAYL